MRLPRKKDLERKQQTILKFTRQSFTDVRDGAVGMQRTSALIFSAWFSRVMSKP